MTKVMIVEDEVLVAEDIRSSLTRIGYEVAAVVHSGEDAVRKAIETRPDIVLMDIVLRGKMNGIEAAESIIAQLNIPVIYLTAHADPMTFERAKMTDPYGYIVKPFETDALQRLIDMALYKHDMSSRLRESEQKFRSLFNQASDSIFLLLPSGDDLIIEDLNYAALETHGYTKDELLGRSISVLDDPETRKHIPGRVHQLMKGNLLHAEGTHIRKDGSTFPVDISAQMLYIGRKPYVLAIDRDISKRKKYESELQERVKVAELSSDIGMSLTTKKSLRESLQSCAEAIVLHLDALFARIWVMNEEEDMLELKASAGLYTHTDGTHSRIRPGHFKIGMIAKNRQPHITNSVIGDPQIPEQEWVKRENIVSFAGYPLVFEDRLVGVMALFSRNTLSDVVMRALSSFSDIVSVSIMEKRAADATFKSRTLLMNVLDGIEAIVYAADMKTYELLYLNNYAKNVFGDVTGKICWQSIQSGQTSPCVFCTNDRLLTPDGRPCGAYHWEFQNTVNGRWYDIRDRAIEWTDGRIVRLEIATDITELKEAEELLRSMSFIDDLTGLHNRRGFLTLAVQQLKTAHREKKKMSLIFIDLDNMKWINDNLGHPAGDQALKSTSDVLIKSFRESDIIARIGGDEFVVLAPEDSGSDTESLTRRLESRIEHYNAEGKRPFDLSLSIGIASYDPLRPSSIEELLYRADSLMYKHKHEKKKGR